MSVLDRVALEDSPLADLHAIASELAIDGYRRLRRADLIDSILAHQSGEDAASIGGETADAEADRPAAEAEPAEDGDEAGARGDRSSARRRRGRRGGRGRGGARAQDDDDSEDAEPVETDGGAQASTEDASAPAEEPEEVTVVEGVVELLPNGSGFLRVRPPDPSDDDVYISAAQVKRCELVSGDVISGPPRAPRRSERFPSLIRVDAINGRPAGEAVEGNRFDDLPATFAEERIPLGSEDPTLKAIEWLTPFGKGSRVIIAGPARAGKTEVLRRLAGLLTERSELTLMLVLTGVRPEELTAWPLDPAAAVSFAASPDVQAQALEPALDTARRLAARGGDVVALIDTLDGLPALAARKAMAAARNITGGGSLTVIATASAPLGGETTVIALDAGLASSGRFPALDLPASGTIHAERLVGDAAAEAIAQARIDAADGAQ